MVLCVLVINRFLNLLQEKYGSSYAWLGGFSVQNVPAGFFQGWATQWESRFYSRSGRRPS